MSNPIMADKLKSVSIVRCLWMMAAIALFNSQNVLSQEQPDADNDVDIDGDPFDLFEGDIIGYKPIEGALYNGVTNKDNLWPGKLVPYEISSVYSAKDRRIIENAVRDFSRKTCLRFRPKSAGDQDYIYIHHLKSGCFAYWGRQRPSAKRQLVNIQVGGCVTHAIVQHELMHTVGFMHEQSRYDRDSYIDIISSNIEAGKEQWFNKQADSDPQGTPYDFGSVMHYTKGTFSKGHGLDTMKPKPKYAGKTLGNDNGITAIDIQRSTGYTDARKYPVHQEPAWAVGMPTARAAVTVTVNSTQYRREIP